MLFAVVLFAVQLPRIDRIIYEYDGAAAPLVQVPRSARRLAPSPAWPHRREVSEMRWPRSTASSGPHAKAAGAARRFERPSAECRSRDSLILSADFTAADLLDFA